MQRIRVVGSSGSGKSTTARTLAVRLGVPCLELDAVHWLPNWQERDQEQFRQLVTQFATSQPRWVIDGNYSSRLGDCLDHLVDTYVWLDMPRWRATLAVLLRTVRRAVTGEELWGTGNRERLSSLFKWDPLDNIVRWSWTQHGRQRARCEALQGRSDCRLLRFRSRREIARFLDSARSEGLEPPTF